MTLAQQRLIYALDDGGGPNSGPVGLGSTYGGTSYDPGLLPSSRVMDPTGSLYNPLSIPGVPPANYSPPADNSRSLLLLGAVALVVLVVAWR